MLDEIFDRYPRVTVQWDADWNEYRASVGADANGKFGRFTVFDYADTPAEAIRLADARARFQTEVFACGRATPGRA
ncbi:hypothetical protein MKY59_21410 [Paenibacillus sp. FSL W8-0426]|uniref:hypothetical protein n=1 Tax=Paenibacillus sp. FSL W8-0426 TaxID=2921714 RepID=UPI0030D78046